MNGYWGDNTYQTMAHQSTLLGIPSVQLEIPYTMRQELMANDRMMADFAAALFDVYKEVVLTRQVMMIQGTFGVIQGTFGMIQGTFGVIQGTFGVIQGTFGVIQMMVMISS